MVIKFFFPLQGKAPKEIHAILTEALACLLPGRAKYLSAPLYIHKGYKVFLALNMTALPSLETRPTTQRHNQEYLNIQSHFLQNFEKSYSHASLGTHFS